MGNGHGPPLELDAADYDTIKNGTVINGGTYHGCVQVGATYHYVMPGSSSWELKTGTPERGSSAITGAVWDLCKAGGTYDWDAQNENWEEPEEGTPYRWAAGSGGDVVLVEV